MTGPAVVLLEVNIDPEAITTAIPVNATLVIVEDCLDLLEAGAAGVMAGHWLEGLRLVEAISASVP